MTLDKNVIVYGAYGHTGRFVITELLRRGLTPILSGRNEAKLKALGDEHPELEARAASVDDLASFDRAFRDAALVINCAGPFLDTATPVIEAALRAGVHYLDVTAEQQATLDTFEKYADAARDSNIVIAPAMAFYGGLGDLLATAAMRNWVTADEIRIAIGLDSWKPTLGTRLTGKRNTARRMVVSNGSLKPLSDPSPTCTWNFPVPFGTQKVVALPLAEIITISHHLRTSEIYSYMNLIPLEDLHDPATPEPTAADATGLSAQRFVMDVIVRKGSEKRRGNASGRDIYAITAPIVVEAAERILDGRIKKTGVAAASEIFDANDFLQGIRRAYPFFEIHFEQMTTKTGGN
jgi:NAD(P)-dependent dehydrogenase (short-subunit alcohol dehydrogenase family)